MEGSVRACVRDAVAGSRRLVRGLEKGVGRVGLLWDSGEGDTTLVVGDDGGTGTVGEECGCAATASGERGIGG